MESVGNMINSGLQVAGHHATAIKNSLGRVIAGESPFNEQLAQTQSQIEMIKNRLVVLFEQLDHRTFEAATIYESNPRLQGFRHYGDRFQAEFFQVCPTGTEGWYTRFNNWKSQFSPLYQQPITWNHHPMEVYTSWFLGENHPLALAHKDTLSELTLHVNNKWFLYNEIDIARGHATGWKHLGAFALFATASAFCGWRALSNLKTTVNDIRNKESISKISADFARIAGWGLLFLLCGGAAQGAWESAGYQAFSNRDGIRNLLG